MPAHIKANELHDVQGTTPRTKRSQSSVRLNVLTGVPPPKFLGAEAKAHWRITFKLLSDCRVMTKNDMDTLSIYCEAYATWKMATMKLRTEGLVQSSQHGTEQPSPYIKIINQSFLQLKALIAELGLSPAARARITPLPDDAGSDDWSDL